MFDSILDYRILKGLNVWEWKKGFPLINWYMWFSVEYWHVYCFPVLDIQFKETKYIVLNDNETVDDLVVIINNYMSSY